MRNTKINLTTIACLILGSICFLGCSEIHDYIDGRISTDCPDGIYADTIPNQLIISFNPKINPDAKGDFLRWLKDSLGATEISTCPCDEDLALVEFPKDKVIDLNTSRRQADSRIKDEDNGTVHYNFEINLDLAAGNSVSFYTNKQVQAVSVSEIAVAVIDGGLNPKLFPSYLTEYSYDFTKGDSLNEEIEVNPHGSIVGEIILKDLKALPVQVKLIDLKVFDKEGKGNMFYGLCAISNAIKNNADIINMSWGMYMPIYDSLFLKYLEKTRGSNILVVASAGNDKLNTNSCLHFPSGYNSASFITLGNIIGVASLAGSSDILADYSNYGTSTIGIAAYEGHADGFSPYEGTSFAVPVVVNHAIKIIANNPTITNTKIVNCILESADTIAGLKVISRGKLNTTVVACP